MRWPLITLFQCIYLRSQVSVYRTIGPLVRCHDIPILGRSPTKDEHPDVTTADDWDVKHQIKQTNQSF